MTSSVTSQSQNANYDSSEFTIDPLFSDYENFDSRGDVPDESATIASPKEQILSQNESSQGLEEKSLEYNDFRPNYEEQSKGDLQEQSPKVIQEFSNNESTPVDKKHKTRYANRDIHSQDYVEKLFSSTRSGQLDNTRLVVKMLLRDMKIPPNKRALENEVEIAADLWSQYYNKPKEEILTMIDSSFEFFRDFCHTKKFKKDLQVDKRKLKQAGTRMEVARVLNCELGRLLLRTKFISLWKEVINQHSFKESTYKKFTNFLEFIEN